MMAEPGIDECLPFMYALFFPSLPPLQTHRVAVSFVFFFFASQNKGMRFVKNVGLGFKTPKLAREGTYVDKKCPFTGDVSIRGRILKAR